MKMLIDTDEFYPYLSLIKHAVRPRTPESSLVDIPDSLLERYNKAETEFFAVQDILYEMSIKS